MDKKKLAVIHIIKKELSLSDTEYREILQKAAGVSSAKDLNDRQFRLLMKYFVRSRHYKVNPYGLTIRQKLFIKNLAQGMGWDNGHLDNFILKYYHKRHVNDLSKRDAIKVIEALKHIREHQRERYNV